MNKRLGMFCVASLVGVQGNVGSAVEKEWVGRWEKSSETLNASLWLRAAVKCKQNRRVFLDPEEWQTASAMENAALNCGVGLYNSGMPLLTSFVSRAPALVGALLMILEGITLARDQAPFGQLALSVGGIGALGFTEGDKKIQESRLSIRHRMLALARKHTERLLSIQDGHDA